MLRMCSQADSMDSPRGEWYPERQIGEPVAPRELCQGGELLNNVGHKDG